MDNINNDYNKGISCNVNSCVFNEGGKNCNLDKVSISKGDGANHYCKSYIPLNDERAEFKFPLENEERFHSKNIESSEEYFDFGELIDDIEKKID